MRLEKDLAELGHVNHDLNENKEKINQFSLTINKNSHEITNSKIFINI